MDGRPHPPEWAPHTWMGFSRAGWVGDRLIVETTHIKQGWHRRNGVPASDWTTMTEHYIRHGNYFTHIEVIRDPVYLTEPMVKSQHFELNPRELPSQTWLWPCTAVEEVATRGENDVRTFSPARTRSLGRRAKRRIYRPTVRPAGLPRSIPNGSMRSAGPSPRTVWIEAAPPRAPDSPADEVHIWPIRDNIYMLVGAGANSTVQVGDDGVLVVDTKLTGAGERLVAAIRSITDKPIRFIVNTNADADNIGGNEAVSKAGSTRTGGVVVRQIGEEIVDAAAIVAHENVLARVSAPTGEASALPQAAWPTDTFYRDRREFPFDGEGIVLMHARAAHTDGDLIVFFRRSDVISAGDVFSTTGYPVIDAARGGSIQGLLAALNEIIEIAIPDVDHQGGTMIVPAHGRLSDEMDVVEYRDMITIVRDRIQAMLDEGKSLEEVRAARPTYDFDARYGAETGPWTTTMFVDAIYRDLEAARR